MKYARYALFVIVSLLATLFVMIFAPVIALFTRADGNLPPCLYWCQTFDATLDAGWKDGYFGTWQANGAVPTGFALWFLRTKWLWRNPAYATDYFALGIAFDPSAWTVKAYTTVDGVTVFQASAPNAFNYEYGGKHLQIKLGHKAWNYFDPKTGKFRTAPWGPAMRAPLCFTIVPRF